MTMRQQTTIFLGQAWRLVVTPANSRFATRGYSSNRSPSTNLSTSHFSFSNPRRNLGLCVSQCSQSEYQCYFGTENTVQLMVASMPSGRWTRSDITSANEWVSTSLEFTYTHWMTMMQAPAEPKNSPSVSGQAPVFRSSLFNSVEPIQP